MLQVMNITKALADESRIRILLALHHKGELCVCHLIDLLELAPSTVSKHLFLLKNARMLLARKEGRWVHYRLNHGKSAPRTVVDALAWITRSVFNNPVMEEDRQRLDKMICNAEPENPEAEARTAFHGTVHGISG